MHKNSYADRHCLEILSLHRSLSSMTPESPMEHFNY